jgi:uncharacterized protein
MSNIVLSLDGRREINDEYRPTVNGKGSYDLVLPRFKALTEERMGDYFIRGTFTSKNLDFLADILHIAELGFKNVSIEPVVLPDDHELAIKAEHLPVIFEQYDRLAELMARENMFNFFHFNVDLAQGPCVYKRLRGCGAGGEYAAVTPDGNLYPCHQFAGREEYKMGNVWDDVLDIPPISAALTTNHITTRSGCLSCWAKYFCGGGCAAANLNTTGDVNASYSIGCEMQKKRLECAIALACLRQVASGDTQ